MDRERIIQWNPAFDKRASDPAKNYGIGSMSLRFILKGETAATQFMMLTGWYLPENRGKSHSGLMGTDVGYHSTLPLYDGQERNSCDIFGECYYDGSGLRAIVLMEQFIAEGDGVVWTELESYLDSIERRQKEAQEA